MSSARISQLFVLSFLVALFALGLAVPVNGAQCPQGSDPGASLLFPFVEVHFEGSGPTTLISITNTASTAQLVNVVLWSNCSRPVLSFTLYLEAGQVQPLNMQQVLTTGQIPSSDAVDTAAFPSCPSTLPALSLGASDLMALRTRLGGDADPNDGLCYAEPTSGAATRGFLTVDVLNDCSSTIRTPVDAGYFAAGGLGLASNANILAGDFFLVDGDNDFSQGFEAVSLRADAELFADAPGSSFYARGDDRQPLSTHYRTRFLDGGAFDGGTDLLVWANDVTDMFNEPSAPPCQCSGTGFIPGLFYAAATEAGEALESALLPIPTLPQRLAVGTDDLPVSADFGSLDLRFYDACEGACPAVVLPRQGLVLPIYSAEGRFSAGLGAVSLEDPCADLNGAD